jgi:hypothetical protein
MPLLQSEGRTMQPEPKLIASDIPIDKMVRIGLYDIAVFNGNIFTMLI